MEKKGKGEREEKKVEGGGTIPRLHNPDFDPPRPSFLSRGQRASKKITFLPIEATYVYNVPRSLIEHTCIRARKIYTRRARAQTRVTACLLGWL